MMNAANEITHQTKLYGFIGVDAGVSLVSSKLNKIFKAEQKDAMMIPLNIREDDYHFTVANMKNSHVNGALISKEFSTSSLEVLDSMSEVVEKSSYYDFVLREDKKLYADVVLVRSLVDYLSSSRLKKVALLGVTKQAKAFGLLARDLLDLSYFSDNLEDLMSFSTSLGCKQADLNRLADGMSVDLSGFDAVVDMSEFSSLDMISSLAKQNFDLLPKKMLSPLKIRSNELGESYFGFEEQLELLSKTIYEYLMSKNELRDAPMGLNF